MRGQDKAEAYYHLLKSMADEYGLEYNPAPGQSGKPKRVFSECPVSTPPRWRSPPVVDRCTPMRNMASPFHRGKPSSTRTGGRSKSAVDRALGKLKQLGMIEGVERRLSYTKSETTLYSITWQPFFTAFQKVEAWKLARRHPGVNVTGVVPDNGTAWSPKSGQVVPENGEHISLTYLSNRNLYRSSYDDPLKDFHQDLSGETQQTSAGVERPKGFQEERTPVAEPFGFNKRQWWTDRLNEAEAELRRSSDPEQCRVIEASIARYRARIEEMTYDQRPKVGTGGR